jgi:hypothetical protein
MSACAVALLATVSVDALKAARGRGLLLLDSTLHLLYNGI